MTRYWRSRQCPNSTADAPWRSKPRWAPCSGLHLNGKSGYLRLGAMVGDRSQWRSSFLRAALLAGKHSGNCRPTLTIEEKLVLTKRWCPWTRCAYGTKGCNEKFGQEAHGLVARAQARDHRCVRCHSDDARALAGLLHPIR